jgi:tRNA(adenine34) deaminase
VEQNRDITYMAHALNLARKALDHGEVPVGAIVVDPFGSILGEGCNTVEADFSQLGHAEAGAIYLAGKHQKNWRLIGCTLYVTLEPCMMCISLAALSRIERVVYGASSPRYGFSLDREGILRLYTRQIKSIVAGVCASESAMLLEESFIQARKRNDDKLGDN